MEKQKLVVRIVRPEIYHASCTAQRCLCSAALFRLLPQRAFEKNAAASSGEGVANNGSE